MNLSVRNQFIIGLILVFFMVITRGHHFIGLHNLPGASWAAFFLAGIYLRPVWVLGGLLAITWGLDFSYYFWGNGSNFCFSQAYIFLVAAYAALWWAGRWFSRHYRFHWQTLPFLFSAMFGGAVVCEIISSGSFYFLSGRFEDQTIAEFGQRFITYFPHSLQSISFYTGMAVIVHILLGLFAQQHKLSGARQN